MRIRIALALLGAGFVIGAQGLAATHSATATHRVAAAQGAPSQPGIDSVVDDFVYGSLALSPVTATQQGYHTNAGHNLDSLLDDYSAAGIEHVIEFNRGINRRIGELDMGKLDAEQKADLAILRNAVGLALFDVEQTQVYRHNPTLYVELVGNALNGPYTLEYAPLEQRFVQIIARLKLVPKLMAQAKANLADSPEVWNRVAREENDGNIELIDTTLRAAVPATMQRNYTAAAAPALVALQDFNKWLAGSLAQHTSDWRLGADNYRRRCRYVLADPRSPQELLEAAEGDLKSLRAEAMRLAAPRPVEQALADVASHHTTPAGYLDAARKDLSSATEFVRAKNLLTLPTEGTVSVVETPEFLRGTYGVGGFNPAPALEPQLGSFYWVTPIPADWPQERVDSKLREYNDYGMQHLTVHEAMPGHFVQAEYANQVQPLGRRLLRNIWGNGPYVEGWAVYTQQMMTDEGYLDGDPAFRMTLIKQLLRATANTILDIRLQTMNMTDEQAISLMVDQTWQEKEEATAKLQRAQLGSCQLAFYYAGWKGWLEARQRYQARHPKDYSLRQFNEAALRESAVPLSTLDQLLP